MRVKYKVIFDGKVFGFRLDRNNGLFLAGGPKSSASAILVWLHRLDLEHGLDISFPNGSRKIRVEGRCSAQHWDDKVEPELLSVGRIEQVKSFRRLLG